MARTASGLKCFVRNSPVRLDAKTLCVQATRNAIFSGARLVAKQKKLLPQLHGTKAYTSAIPPKLTFPAKCPLATRTIIRAPMDNGWGPVSPYWNEYPFKAALRSPFADCFPSRFHHPGLSVVPHLPVTTLLHRFFIFDVKAIICT